MAKVSSSFLKVLIELLIAGVFVAALLPSVVGIIANISLSDPIQALLISVVGIVIVAGVVYKFYKMALGNL